MSHTLPTVTTAAEYAERYEQALEHGQLIQSDWHDTAADGRWLACALGVIGEEVDSPGDCPATIMPRWLAQMVPFFFDRQTKGDAFAWGKEFTAQLARLDGKVPFSVVHDWHANTVCLLGIEAAEKRGHDPAPHKALQALHLRVLNGEKIGAEEWRPILKNADAYADANAYAYAYAYANANAYANADADANGNAYAYAYADADADANADANANAYADAYAYVYAIANAWKRLAEGMTEALSRVSAEQVSA
jgi:hypothetical protein